MCLLIATARIESRTVLMALCLFLFVQAVARYILDQPANNHMHARFINDQGEVLPRERAVKDAAVAMQYALPHVLELLEHAALHNNAGRCKWTGTKL